MTDSLLCHRFNIITSAHYQVIHFLTQNLYPLPSAVLRDSLNSIYLVFIPLYKFHEANA